MDRALNLAVLAGALDDTVNLPSPGDLRSMLADAEVAAFFHQADEIDPRLLVTAWNLHHVGTARPQLQLYETSRQIQANSVASHVFDLALQGEGISNNERLVLTFAAQVSAIRGDRTPNASALGRRLPTPSARLGREPGKASLELGCAFLTLDRSATVGLLRDLSRQVQAVSSSPDVPLGSSGLASAVGVVDGVRQLQRYLTYGAQENLEGARQILTAAATSTAARHDLDSRWVAAHLVDLCDDLGGSSVWSILPDGTPPGVGQAMTLGDPPVMTLWPPQVSLSRVRRPARLRQRCGALFSHIQRVPGRLSCRSCSSHSISPRSVPACVSWLPATAFVVRFGMDSTVDSGPCASSWRRTAHSEILGEFTLLWS